MLTRQRTIANAEVNCCSRRAILDLETNIWIPEARYEVGCSFSHYVVEQKILFTMCTFETGSWLQLYIQMKQPLWIQKWSLTGWNQNSLCAKASSVEFKWNWKAPSVWVDKGNSGNQEWKLWRSKQTFVGNFWTHTMIFMRQRRNDRHQGEHGDISLKSIRFNPQTEHKCVCSVLHQNKTCWGERQMVFKKSWSLS